MNVTPNTIVGVMVDYDAADETGHPYSVHMRMRNVEASAEKALDDGADLEFVDYFADFVDAADCAAGIFARQIVLACGEVNYYDLALEEVRDREAMAGGGA